MGRTGRRGLHRRSSDRRDARPQRPAPGPLHRDRRRTRGARLGDRRAADSGREDRPVLAPPAGPHAPDRPGEGPDRRRRGDQGRARRRAPLRRMGEEHPDRARRPEAGHRAREPHRRVAARSAAGLRLQPGRPQAAHGAHGRDRPGGRRLDGHRHAALRSVRQVEVALHLLQAELRSGHEPADRPDPRGSRDEPRLVHRPASEPARHGRRLAPEAPRGAPADPDQHRSREDPLDRPFRGPVRHQDPRHYLPGRDRRGGDERSARPALRPRGSGGARRLQHHRPVRPRGRPRPHPDPGAARDGGGAQLPDPQGASHLGRPRGRVGRAARDPSFRVPGRIRRRGDQPVSRLRDACGDEARVPAGSRRRGNHLPLHQVDR